MGWGVDKGKTVWLLPRGKLRQHSKHILLIRVFRWCEGVHIFTTLKSSYHPWHLIIIIGSNISFFLTGTQNNGGVVAKSLSTSCSPPGSSVHRIFPGKNIGVGCHFLVQGIFMTQGSNPYLLRFRRILYHWVTKEAQNNGTSYNWWHLFRFC